MTLFLKIFLFWRDPYETVTHGVYRSAYFTCDHCVRTVHHLSVCCVFQAILPNCTRWLMKEFSLCPIISSCTLDMIIPVQHFLCLCRVYSVMWIYVCLVYVNYSWFIACLKNPLTCLTLQKKFQGPLKYLKTDEVLESTGKYLKSPWIIVHSMLKVALNVYYKWVVLQMCYKQVYVVILSAALYSVQCLSHCNLKFWHIECRIWLFIDNFGASIPPMYVLESPWIWYFEYDVNPDYYVLQ